MLGFEQVYATIPSNGWLYKEEARLLWEVAKEREGPILEVGSYKGRSTVLLASLGYPVISVDPFSDFDSGDMSGDSIYVEFLQNLQERCITNVSVNRMKIENYQHPWNGPPLKFAYLDGDHTCQGTINQIIKALSFGITTMCIHDYEQSGGGVEIVKAIKTCNLQVVRVVERMAHCEF